MTVFTRYLSVGFYFLILLSACTPGDNSGTTSLNKSETANAANKVESRMALGTRSVWRQVPDDGVELGLGWDSREGRIVPNRCVRMAPIRSTGQTTVMSLDEVSNRTDLMKSLNVSAAGSVQVMFVSVSGSASFAKSSKISSQSTTLLLNATVTNGTLFAGPADPAAPTRNAFPAVGESVTTVQHGDNIGRLMIEPWALKLMKRPAEFRAFCGDGFVSAITSGARLIATFTFSSTSVEQRQAAAASLKASYGPANLSTNFSESEKRNDTEVKTNVRYMQVGGTEGAIATTDKELKDKLKVLAAEAYKSPHFQDMRITPFSQMAEWRGSDAWRDTDDEYDIIAETYWELTTLEEDIIDIIANYAEYNERTGRTVKELEDFQDDILSLRQSIYSALSNETAEQVPVAATNKLVQLFKPASPKANLTAPSGINLKVLSKNPSLAQLASELKNALPHGNASLLRINLPIPNSVLNNINTTEKSTLQRAVIDWYITPIARRACQNNPSDNNCLNNKELAKIASMVPVR